MDKEQKMYLYAVIAILIAVSIIFLVAYQPQ